MALDYAGVNPLAFEPAIAPHLAAREAAALTVLLLGPMRNVLAKGADLTLIEGAGRWRCRWRIRRIFPIWPWPWTYR